MKVIELTNNQIKRLQNLANDALPFESCALLSGTWSLSSQRYTVKNIIPMENSDRSEVSFSIDPQSLLEGYKAAQSMGFEIIAIFHSHPSIPYPSEIDKRYMEINPVIWIIYSTTINKFKCFKDAGQEIEEVAMEIS